MLEDLWRATFDHFRNGVNPRTNALANFVGNGCDARRHAFIEFGSADRVEQRAESDQRQFFMANG